ncbi:MAG: (2Fe-2S)-binding protein [Ilumatobacteraceae bacterium]
MIASGARTVEDVIASSTASSGCGRCRESIEHLLASALAHEQGEEA